MKAGPGRPKGSKDKSYLKLTHWHDELKKDWGKLKPAQRAKLSVQIMQMLINKLKGLPVDPEESVSNTEDAMKMLRELENGKTEVTGTEKGSDVVSHPTPLPPEA